MRIPFELRTESDTDDTVGFLYLEGEFLVFDYHVLRWGVTEEKPSTVKAERRVIDGVRVEEGWYRDRLLVATRSVNLLKAIPGSHLVEVELRTRRKHRAEVDAFVQAVLAWKEEAA